MAVLYLFYYFDSNQFENVGRTKQILTKRNMFQISLKILKAGKKIQCSKFQSGRQNKKYIEHFEY